MAFFATAALVAQMAYHVGSARIWAVGRCDSRRTKRNCLGLAYEKRNTGIFRLRGNSNWRTSWIRVIFIVEVRWSSGS